MASLFLELSNTKGTFTPTNTLHPNEIALDFRVVTKGERTAMGKSGARNSVWVQEYYVGAGIQ